MGAIGFKTPSGDDMVIIPAADYARLLEASEMAEDTAAYDEIKRQIVSGEEELVPSDVANRLIDGESPVRVWREYRGMSARALAQAAGLSQPYVTQIESGRRAGSAASLAKIAKALGVSVDDLLPD